VVRWLLAGWDYVHPASPERFIEPVILQNDVLPLHYPAQLKKMAKAIEHSGGIRIYSLKRTHGKLAQDRWVAPGECR